MDTAEQALVSMVVSSLVSGFLYKRYRWYRRALNTAADTVTWPLRKLLRVCGYM